jgi:hypothetical protein
MNTTTTTRANTDWLATLRAELATAWAATPLAIFIAALAPVQRTSASEKTKLAAGWS